MFYLGIRKLLKIKLFQSLVVKMSTDSMSSDAKAIFQAAVTAVQPENLIEEAIEVHSNCIKIQGKSFPLIKNAHIVGFGKAVLGMAITLENKLKEHLVHGILSIPEGTIDPPLTKQGTPHKTGSCIQIYEGAAKNIPDVNSLLAASEIVNYISSLKESDLLFVLISGGGSALLPAPKSPLTLEEKQKVITLLASKGATIEELNAVRKRLSEVKGGKLAERAKPAKVISLILSDIIGDSLSIIASGPTVENIDDPTLPLSIIEKYQLQVKIPQSALLLLKNASNTSKSDKKFCFSHVNNFIIGNNQIALNAAAQMSKQLNFNSIIMTSEMRGIASSVGKKLVSIIMAAINSEIKQFNCICDELQLPTNSKQELLNMVDELKQQGKQLCVLFGGETTVEVHGTGIGGRNQELALSAAISLSAKKPKNEILLLSAGTDGIDGPTPAAGAIATSYTVDQAKSEGLDAEEYLKSNDSYTFYSRTNGSEWLVKTGHTGTNVMDIIIILVK